MKKIEAIPSPLQIAINSVLLLSIEMVMRELRERLGSHVLIEIADLPPSRSDSNSNGGWDRRETTLRAALQAVRTIAERYDDAAARAWLGSSNPSLQMRSPIVVLLEAHSLADCERIVVCAVQDVG
jgi:hypothetical protein